MFYVGHNACVFFVFFFNVLCLKKSKTNNFNSLFSGSLQSRKATMQILSPTTTSQRSASNQWTKSSCLEECPYATNGHGARTTSYSWTSAGSGKLIKQTSSSFMQLLLSNFCFKCNHLLPHTTRALFSIKCISNYSLNVVHLGIALSLWQGPRHVCLITNDIYFNLLGLLVINFHFIFNERILSALASSLITSDVL